MKKIILQLSITVALFIGAWYALAQFDLMKLFQVEKVTNKTEEKLGTLFWESIKATEYENKNPFVEKTLDSIVNHICEANEIDRAKLKVHVVNTDEINAFALPDGHLVINSGLILNADQQEEMIGVICHEIAHIELNHIMKKLVNEIGLSVLISMATGNNGGKVISETVGMLSSNAFSRDLEREADIQAVDYLINAHINPEPFANFLYKLSGEESEYAEYLTWISTHPDSRERAEYVANYSQDHSREFQTVISEESWTNLHSELNDYSTTK